MSDELRGLFIDIEVRGVEEATKDIQAASTATDSLAEDFRGLVDDSELAAQAISHTEEKVEALGDSLTKTAGGVMVLQAALSSLTGTQIGDIGDVDLSNTTLPEDRTIQQTLSRDVTTNQPDIDSGEFASATANAHLYSEGLDDVAESNLKVSAATQAAINRVDEAGDEFSGSALEALVFGRSLSKIRNEAYSTIPGLSRTEDKIEEIGDESTSSAAQVLALRSALQGLGSTSSGVSLGPFSVGIGTAIVAVSTLIPLVLSLGAALGGLATAAIGAAGVIGGAFAGGLLGLENTEQVLTEFKTSLEEATAPLQTEFFQNFSLDVLQGAVKLMSQFSHFAASTFKQISPLVDLVAGAFWDNTPEFFASLNYAITELSPLIAEFMTWFAEGIPDAIRYLTDVTKDLAPTLANLGQSVMEILPPLIDLGVTIFNTLGPALALLIDGLNLVVSAFNALPEPAQQGIILSAAAIFTLVGAISLLGSAIAGIIGLIETFTTVLAVGKLIYGLVGGVGILSTALGGLSTALYAAGGAVSTFLGLIGPVGWAILAIGAGIAAYQSNLFGFADAVDSIASGLVDLGSGILNAVLNPVESLNDALQWLSNVDVIDVAVNLIKQGAEDLWDWLTPDMGNLGEEIKQMQKEAEKKYQNASPQEKKRMQMVMETGQEIQSPDLGNLIPDIPDTLSMPEISMPDIPEIPQLDLSGLVPDIDLPQIDLWGSFADSFPRTAREIREETQLLKSYWEGLKIEAGNLKEGFDSLIGTPVAEFFQGLTNIPGDLKEGFDNLIGTPIADWFDSVVSDAQEWGNKLVEAIPSIPKITLPEISIPDISIPKLSWPDISLPDIPDFGEALKTGLDVTLASIIDPEEWVPKVASHWYNEGVNAVDSFISGIQNWLSGGLQSTWDRLTPNVGSWFSDGQNAADTFVDGITSIDIGKRVGDWLKGLVPFMPSSDAQTGPLSNLTSWGESLGETIVSGIRSTNIGKQVGNWLQSTAQGFKQWGEGIYNSIRNNLPSLSDIQSALPDMPSLGELAPDVSIPDIETPSLPDLGSLTPDVNLPSMDDIQSSIPSMGEIMPDVSMPEVPDVPDLPSIDDLTPSIQMPDMPSVDLPSMGELMPSVSMPNIPSPSLPNIGSMIPSLQMPNLPSMGNIGGAIPDIGPILGGNPLGGLTAPNPAPISSSTDNRTQDNSTNVSNQQNWEINIEESDNPQQVRKEIQKASGLSAEDLVGALQGHNE